MLLRPSRIALTALACVVAAPGLLAINRADIECSAVPLRVIDHEVLQAAPKVNAAEVTARAALRVNCRQASGYQNPGFPQGAGATVIIRGANGATFTNRPSGGDAQITNGPTSQRGLLSVRRSNELRGNFEIFAPGSGDLPSELNYDISGIRWNANAFAFENGLGLSAVARIEIIRGDGAPLFEDEVPLGEPVRFFEGSATASYGSDAIGGVINIITKQPNALPGPDDNFRYTRFGFRFKHIPEGARITVPGRLGSSSPGSFGAQRVIGADEFGQGGSPAPTGSQTLDLNPGVNDILYEITSGDPLNLESFNFGYELSFPQTIPEEAVRNILVAFGYAPLSQDDSASATAPIPRFGLAYDLGGCDVLQLFPQGRQMGTQTAAPACDRLGGGDLPSFTSVVDGLSFHPRPVLTRGSFATAFGSGFRTFDGQTSFPLDPNPNGIEIRIEQNGIEWHGTPLYSNGSQFNLLVNNDWPQGLVNISYCEDGVCGDPFQATIREFGVNYFTVNGTFGIAQKFSPKGAVSTVTLDNALAPGDAIAIWGAGGGASSQPTEEQPVAENFLDFRNYEFYLGGQRVDPIYFGPSGCCSNVNVAVLTVPDLGSDGFVPFMTLSPNGAMSNTPMFPYSADGGQLEDDVNYRLSWGLYNDGPFGTLTYSKIGLRFDLSGTLAYQLTEGFSSRYAQLDALTFNPGVDYPAPGQCYDWWLGSENLDDALARPPINGLDIGPSGSLEGAGGSQQLTEISPGYDRWREIMASFEIAPGFYADGPYTFNQPSAQGPAFQEMFNFSTPGIEVTSPAPGDVLDSGQDLEITWRISDDFAAQSRFAYLLGVSRSGDETSGFLCTVDPLLERFTVRAGIMANLLDTEITEDGVPRAAISMGTLPELTTDFTWTLPNDVSLRGHFRPNIGDGVGIAFRRGP